MERYSSCGRILNRTMTMREICNYLGIENNKSKDFKKEVCKEFGELEKDFKNKDIDNSKAIKEYKQFENKYYNQNVEFCLLCDIESGLIKPTNIIEKGKYIIVFE